MKAKIGSRLLQALSPQTKPYEVWDTDLPGFVLRVQPTGIMTYVCSYRLTNGRKNRIVLGKASVLSPAQARDHAKDLLADVRRGSDPALAKRLARIHALRAFLDEKYGPWVLANRKAGAATLARIKSRFAEFLDKPLGDLNVWVLEKYRTQRLKTGLKKATINRDTVALKAALSKAVEWKILVSSPLRDLRPIKVDDSDEIRVRYLGQNGEDEEARLRAALDAREERIRSARDSANQWRQERNRDVLPNLRTQPFADRLKPMVLLSLNTGMRRGEIFSLRWRAVNFRPQTVTVEAASAKGGKTKHIPLNQEALTVLSAWASQQIPTSDAHVFPSDNGDRLDNVASSWERLLEDAKITGFRWHDMRHHFASSLVMAGVDLNTVRELLGHSDIKMTLRYAHLRPAVKAAAVAKLDGARSKLYVRERDNANSR